LEKAPTAAAELGSSAALAGTSSFQKLVAEKKRNGTVREDGVAEAARVPSR
jgi:hypothetical protein